MSQILTFGLGRRSTVARPSHEIIQEIIAIPVFDADLEGEVVDLDVVEGLPVMLEADEVIEIVTPVVGDVEDLVIEGEVPCQ